VRAELDGGPVALHVDTQYPHQGLVTVTVTETIGEEWELSLRVPAWATAGATLRVNGEAREVQPGIESVRRAFAVGDTVELELVIEPRFTWPDPRVDAVRGSVAVERGPLVLALESVDLPGGLSVNEVRLDTAVAPRDHDDTVAVALRSVSLADATWPYEASDEDALLSDSFEASLVPYYHWANRGPSTMRVWLPSAES
jgi:DUF1680 family protein